MAGGGERFDCCEEVGLLPCCGCWMGWFIWLYICITDGTRGIDCALRDLEVLRMVGEGDISRGGAEPVCSSPIVSNRSTKQAMPTVKMKQDS